MSASGHAIPQQDCPVCERPMDRAVAVRGNALPQPGDVTLCRYCRAVLLFDVDLKLVQPSALEWAAWPAQFRAQLASLQQALRNLGHLDD